MAATVGKHDIFLSHSGRQKGFVRDLYIRLCSEGHTVFFDENVDSLPPGKLFPPLIFSAISNCKLALIILSDDFLSTKWPMMELCAFFDRLSSQSNKSDSSFTILPLFYKLCPADIKDKSNVKEKSNVTKWREIWMKLEHGCINASKCEEIVTKTLPHLNGVVRRPESEQGEASYIEDIINRISSILRPRNHLRLRYGVNPDKLYVGIDRLIQVIVDKFRKLEEDKKSCSEIMFLGMYGVPGNEKSTICDFMTECMFDELRGNAIHLTLPTNLTAKDASEVKEQYVNLLSMVFPSRKSDFPGMNLQQLYNQLYYSGDCFRKMFLVLDNISPSNYESYKVMIQTILRSNVLGHGSRVMVVAQSRAILENLLMECKHNHHSITEVPSLIEEEAKQLVRNQFPSIKEDVVNHLLHKCRFESSSFIHMYIPFVF